MSEGNNNATGNGNPFALPISQGSPLARPLSPAEGSWSRAASNARLASPIPSYAAGGVRSPGRSRQVRTNNNEVESNGTIPLAGSSNDRPSNIGPGASALASALNASIGRTSQASNATAGTTSEDFLIGRYEGTQISSNRESFSHRALLGEPVRQGTPTEDFDIIRKHLAGPAGDVLEGETKSVHATEEGDGHGGELSLIPSLDNPNFSSLRMQGGDITREIYRRTEADAIARQTRIHRSRSFNDTKAPPIDGEPDIGNIKKPGGFRRDHLRRAAISPSPRLPGSTGIETPPGISRPQPSYLTSNFFEFLTIYGHFAGETVEEDEDEDSGTPRDISSLQHSDDEDEGSAFQPPGERSSLLRHKIKRRKSYRDEGLKKGTSGTVLILLKSFVGTGVLFLPRAFLNGGMLFSGLVLVLVALLSNYCFILLTKSRLALGGSFAEMGEDAHGKVMRFLINFSLVISQVGFASAYIVFTSENLQAFILAVSNCETFIDIKWMVLMQMIVFLPLSLYRNLGKLAFVVYIADVFIVLGLVYLYYSGLHAIVDHGGISDIKLFNQRDWTLFIGTAIFTFEGIGLIIPIQDGMKKPEKLPRVLGGVMIGITFIFVSMGALSYAAYGSKTETVIILNMPQDNKFVNGVQFMYSLAILLSTPLQIYPAITIMEKGIFTRSGKFSKGIKWRKNIFRFIVVVACALIAWVGAGDLDKFVALVGSFACIPLVYIYPPLIHRKAVATRKWTIASDYALCAFGMTLMAYTSILTISSWIHGSGIKKHKGYCDK